MDPPPLLLRPSVRGQPLAPLPHRLCPRFAPRATLEVLQLLPHVPREQLALPHERRLPPRLLLRATVRVRQLLVQVELHRRRRVVSALLRVQHRLDVLVLRLLRLRLGFFRRAGAGENARRGGWKCEWLVGDRHHVFRLCGV